MSEKDRIEELPFFIQICKKISSQFGNRSTKNLEKQLSPKDLKAMEKAINFADLKIKPYEVIFSGYILALFTFIFLLIISMIFFLTEPIHGVVLDFFGILVLIIMPMLTLPLVVLIYTTNYPASYSNILKIRALGRMAEVIFYLTISMRLIPSLDRAIKFASENVDKPLSTGLKKVLWDVYTRKYDTIETALLAFADEWGEWSEDFKRAIYSTVSAQLETSDTSRNITLQRTNDIILEGTKAKLIEYQSKLGGPTMVLFSLGIMLPLMMGALIPMAIFSGIQLTTFQIFFIMDFIFPVVTIIYALFILRKRPEALVPPKIKPKKTRNEQMILLVMGLVFGLLVGIAIYELGAMSGNGDLVYGVSFCLGISTIFFIYFYGTTYLEKKERKRVIEMENQFPDALFQLGNRIREGMPFETALKKVSESLKGSHISKEFRRYSYAIQMTHQPPEEVLFGHNGILNDAPSKTIQNTMKVVVGTLQKDTATAGQMITGISRHLMDLKKVEQDIRIGLNSIVSMMQSTAVLFAPIVMGVTVALYNILLKTLVGINVNVGKEAMGFGIFFGGSQIPIGVFSFIIGLYLLFMVLIVMYFCSSVMSGEDNLERKYLIGVSMPVAMIIYAITFVASQGMLG